MTATITGAAPPSLLERAVSSTTATFDVGLRTGLATLLSGSFIPIALSGAAVRRKQALLEHYAALSEAGDPDRVFITPPRVEVRARGIRPPVFARGVGAV